MPGWNAPTATAAQSPIVKPAKMPIPPRLGVGAADQRSPVGTFTIRPARGERSRAQITAEAAGSAMIATAVLIVRPSVSL